MNKRNLNEISAEFPILSQTVNDESLIYLDNAATSQKPQLVIDRMIQYYQEDNANIHRGVHSLAQRATEAYESSRQKLAEFINADSEEILFTSGTTAGINQIARSLIEPLLNSGDAILTTELEHHSNYVPWQELAKRTNTQLLLAPLNETFKVDIDQLRLMDTSHVKILAIQHVSNVLGVQQPIKELVDWAHERNIIVVVDGAQAVAHMSVDVHELGVDAYCFSGHKMYGPTGIGICYLAKKWHEICQPFFYGGEMIHQVETFESNYKMSPWKFEGGTPPIGQAIALGDAVDFIQSIGFETIENHEQDLTRRLFNGLKELEGIHLLPNDSECLGSGIVSFVMEGVHPHDAATGFDMEGVAVRAGHHCAQPLMRKLQVPATLRASVGIYNTSQEIEQFIQITQKVREYFTNGFESIK